MASDLLICKMFEDVHFQLYLWHNLSVYYKSSTLILLEFLRDRLFESLLAEDEARSAELGVALGGDEVFEWLIGPMNELEH